MQAHLETPATASTSNTNTSRRPRRGNPNGAVARQMSSYARRVDDDVSTLLSALAPSPIRKVERGALLRRLKNLVSAHFGPRFDVEDVSMWRYAHDLHDSPMEFAIVDTESSLVHPHPESIEIRPSPYSPSDLALLLQSEGFNGVFRSSPDQIQPKKSGRAKDSPQECTTAWPTPKVNATRELIFPTCLEVRTPTVFSLWSPGPTILPLVDLLSSYSILGGKIPQMISWLYLWTRSFNLQGLTPFCLALMVIHYFQARLNLPILQMPLLGRDAQQPDQAINADPIRARIPQQSTGQNGSSTPLHPLDIDISFRRLPWFRDPSSRSTGDVVNFFKYWSISVPKSHSSVVSIREKIRINRSPGNNFGDKEPKPVTGNKSPSVVSQEDVCFQPPSWRLHPFVIQDPFVFTYNHAASISLTTFNEFSQRIKETSNLLQRLMPITTSLGHAFDIPRKLSTRSGTVELGVGAEALQMYEASRIPGVVLQNRAWTIRRIQGVINHHHGGKYQIAPFGSTCYGVDSIKSDLDLVILDPENPTGFEPGDKKGGNKQAKIYKVRLLGNQLRRAGFRDVVSIPKATVPIVKFSDPTTGLCCDINVNDRLGTYNTALIKRYCEMLPILRPLLHTIKLWAKPLGLNSPSTSEGTTFSSYALTLMTIAWLQTRGLLPNLQEGLEGQPPDPQRDIFWARVRKQGMMKCDTRFNQLADWKPPHKDLGEALMEWFRFWGEEHRYGVDMMSVKHGGLLSREKHPTPGSSSLHTGSNQGLGVADDDLSLDNEVLEIGEELDGLEMDEEGDEDDEVNEFDVPLDLKWDPILAFPDGAALYVPDPFIPTKNVVSAIKISDIKRFRAECVQALTLLQAGFTLQQLIRVNNEVSSPTTIQHITSPRHNQAGNRGRGANKGKQPAQADATPKPNQKQRKPSPARPTPQKPKPQPSLGQGTTQPRGKPKRLERLS